MKKWLLPILLILVAPVVTNATDKIYSAGELIKTVVENPSIDGRPIILEGEIISEPIERNDGCWVNVTDGSIAIGVFFKDCSQTKQVKFWGQHLVRGDIVRIEGKVYKADKETNGELDIQGETLDVVEPGYPTEESIPTWKFLLSVGFCTIALLFIGDRITQHLKHRKTKNQNLLSGIIENGSRDFY